jgi:Ca2+:H+ antiporter
VSCTVLPKLYGAALRYNHADLLVFSSESFQSLPVLGREYYPSYLCAILSSSCVRTISVQIPLANVEVDSIRRQAHRVARSQHTVGASNYNPFARQRSRDSGNDSENPSHGLNGFASHANTSSAGLDVVPDDPEKSKDSSKSDAQASASDLPVSLATPILDNRSNLESTLPNVLPTVHEGVAQSDISDGVTKDQSECDPDSELTRVDSDQLSEHERRRRSLNRKIPFGAQIRTILFDNHIAAIFLPCIPVGFTLNYLHQNAVAVFCVNFAAIIPSATALSVALNDLNIRSGEKVSALLNQTFG